MKPIENAPTVRVLVRALAEEVAAHASRIDALYGATDAASRIGLKFSLMGGNCTASR